MKQNVIILLLAYIGSFVPAKKTEIPIINKILGRIGSEDNILEGQSTFFIEMKEMAYILNQATKKSLVILDEVGRGTAHNESLILSSQIIDYLTSKNKCFTLFATHILELTKLPSINKQVKNIHFSAMKKNNELLFLYKLIEGSNEQTFAFDVALMAGIPKIIIKKSKEIHDQNMVVTT